MSGTENLCLRCEASARVEGSVEKMLAAKLMRATSFAEPEPKLSLILLPASVDGMSEDDAWRAVCAMRWPDGNRRCPKCGGGKMYTLAALRKFTCAAPECRHRFSALSGTQFASFKKGYVGLLSALMHEGPGYMSKATTSKTAYDVRRRKIANQ